MKLFISQPMNGKTDDEILKVREEAVKFVKDICEDEEIELIDSFFQGAPEEAKPLWYLGKSIQLMSEADAVFFAPGWEEARGCKIEHECALEYGKVIIEMQ